MQIFVDLHVNKTNFHMKGFALGLALKQRRSSSSLSLYRVHNEDLSFPTKDETTSRAYDDTSELHCFNSPGYSSGILQANAMRTTTNLCYRLLRMNGRLDPRSFSFVGCWLVQLDHTWFLDFLAVIGWTPKKYTTRRSTMSRRLLLFVCFCFLKWLVCVTDTNKGLLTN